MNDKDYGPLEEIRRTSAHAVRMVMGRVPEGAEWAGYNALVEMAGDDSPLCGIVRRFQNGEGRKEVEERIRQQVHKQTSKQ